MAGTLSNYRSLYRPRVGSSSGGSSFSSFVSSLTKKNNSAEDAVIDTQYENGQISAETYKTQLNNRLTRTYLTPLQIVTLQEKINTVDEKLVDAKVDLMAKTGEIGKEQVLQYEQAKLDRITQKESTAYQQQATKVQGLVDAVEREKRTNFRIQENLRISQMPEDTSERAYEKAKQFEKLEAMARQDGDQQQADVFATNKINYANAAKKAEINDLITNTRLSNSQTPEAGLGVPDASAGQQFYGQLTGRPAASVSGGQTSGSGVAGVSGNITAGGGTISTPALRNAYESLDRGQKTIERLYADRADKQAMIQTYQAAVSQATGDQKTQLTIALNNLVSDINGIDNQIGISTSNIQDTVERIQDIQAKAAAGAFSQEVKRKNAEFIQAENDIESSFATGKITKDQYLVNAAQLAQEKLLFFNRASDGYSQFGNEGSADSYMQKAVDFERVATNLISTAENAGDYEMVQVEGGSMTNIFGKGLKPGEFTLRNVADARTQGRFDSNYVNINGKFFMVKYPDMQIGNDGFPAGTVINRDLSRIKDQAYIDVYENGKRVRKQVGFLQRKDQEGNMVVKPLLADDYNVEGRKVNGLKTLINQGVFQVNKNGFVEATPPKDIGVVNKALIKTGQIFQGAQNLPGQIDKFIKERGGYPSVGETEQINGRNIYFPFRGTPKAGILQEPLNVVGDLIKDRLKNQQVFGVPGFGLNAQQLSEKAAPYVQKAGDFVGSAFENVKKFGSDIFSKAKEIFGIPQVQAAELPANIQATNRVFGTPTPALEGKAPGAFNPNKEGFAEGTPDEFKQAIINASKKTGISTKIISSLLKAESSFDEDVIYGRTSSPAGAQGIAQFMPATARSLGINPLDPNQAIDAAARYLKSHLDRFGSLEKALAAYNAGAGNVNKYGGIPPFAETQNYVKKIIGEVNAAAPAATPSANPNQFKTADEYVRFVKQATPGVRVNDSVLRSQYNNAVVKEQQKQEAQRQESLRSLAPSPTVTQSAQLRTSSPQPGFDIGRAAQNVGNTIGNTVNNALRSIQNIFSPPKIISPIPSYRPPAPRPQPNIFQQAQRAVAPVVQRVQRAAAPVVQTIQRAAQNVGNFFGNLFRRR